MFEDVQVGGVGPSGESASQTVQVVCSFPPPASELQVEDGTKIQSMWRECRFFLGITIIMGCLLNLAVNTFYATLPLFCDQAQVVVMPSSFLSVLCTLSSLVQVALLYAWPADYIDCLQHPFSVVGYISGLAVVFFFMALYTVDIVDNAERGAGLDVLLLASFGLCYVIFEIIQLLAFEGLSKTLREASKKDDVYVGTLNLSQGAVQLCLLLGDTTSWLLLSVSLWLPCAVSIFFTASAALVGYVGYSLCSRILEPDNGYWKKSHEGKNRLALWHF